MVEAQPHAFQRVAAALFSIDEGAKAQFRFRIGPRWNKPKEELK
jgi:hypothetical protein